MDKEHVPAELRCKYCIGKYESKAIHRCKFCKWNTYKYLGRVESKMVEDNHIFADDTDSDIPY